MENEGKRGLSSHKLIIIFLIVAALSMAGYIAFFNKGNINISGDKAAETKQTSNDKYQAVFLTNGQVYFGKLTDDGGNYVKLTDIFYLQSKDQTVQPKDAKSADQSNLTLIKLGKELHAPADEMNISRQQVLFWENMNDDGKVMQAIKEYKSSNK